MRTLIVLLGLTLAACEDNLSGLAADAAIDPMDGGSTLDGSAPDPDMAQVGPDMAPVDPDMAAIDPDMAHTDPDMASVDADMAPHDPDMAPVDTDMAPPDPDMAVAPAPAPALNEVTCSGDEWVELYNPHAAPIPLANWVLADPGAFSPLPDVVLDAGAFLRVANLALAIGCDGDRIALLRPDGTEADAVDIQEPPPGATWGRLPDGDGAWQATAATPGAPNAPLAHHTVAINEIHCRGDEWVELYNDGAAAVDLDGWALTDSPGDPARLTPLPAVPIAPGGFVVADTLAFGIACGDDQLTLIAADGQHIGPIDAGDPPRGATHSRIPDGFGPWRDGRPTPGESNRRLGDIVVSLNEVDCHGRDWIELANHAAVDADLTGWSVTDDLAEPGFALDGIVLPARGFDVAEQQTADEDGFTFGIACGTDTIYLRQPGDVVVDEVALPRLAAAFTWGRLPDRAGAWAENRKTKREPNVSAIDDAAVLYDPARVTLVDLVVPQASVDALWAAPRDYVPATFHATVDGVEQPPLEVGVRLKGRIGSFRNLDQKAGFKVKFNEFEPGQRFLGLKRMTLNNQVQDPSTIHEWTAYTIFRAMGVPAPRIGYAFVTLNGDPYGLYANLESPDATFLDRWFASTHRLYEGAYGQDLFQAHVNNLEMDIGDPADRADLVRLVQLLDDPPEAGFYAATQELIDWPELLAAMATEVYTGHWDGYAPTRNNYYFHFDGDDRLSLLPWGTDQTFRRDLDFHAGRGRLMETCMADRDCRAAYDATLATVTTLVAELDLAPQIRALAADLRPWSELDPRRAYSLDRIAAEVDATIAYIDRRQAALAGLLECLAGPDADPDDDGFLCGSDCAPDDPDSYPGAVEICGDGIDQDCNGRVDDGFHCPDCVERFRSGRRYLVCPTPRTYAEARLHCQAAGAEPIIIDNAGEAVWIAAEANAIARQDYWLGLDDIAAEGTFRWWDGTAPAYTRWHGNEPNNAGNNEDCAHIWGGNDTWNDRPCGSSLGVLCEDVCAPGQDLDEDGSDDCLADCDPESPLINPAAEEVCDRVDNDCDGEVDEAPECICVPFDREGRAYHVCTEPLGWPDARAACQARGQDLAVVNDADEGAWLFGTALELQAQDYWIGLSDTAVEGAFVWVDGSPVGFSDWTGGQPDNSGGEDCVHYWGASGQWNDLPCDRRLGFLCEGAPE